MSSILQRLLQALGPVKIGKTNHKHFSNEESQPSFTVSAVPEKIVRSTLQDELKTFATLMMPHIENGKLTHEMLDTAIQERQQRNRAQEEAEHQRVVNEVDVEIETTLHALPESQRQRFLDNLDRDARVNAAVSPWAGLFKVSQDPTVIWIVDAVANITQDPVLIEQAEIIKDKHESWSLFEPFSCLETPLALLQAKHAVQSPETLKEVLAGLMAQTKTSWIMLPSTKEYSFFEALQHQEGYSKETVSQEVTIGLLNKNIPLAELNAYKPFLDQLTDQHLDTIKKHYADAFVQTNFVEQPGRLDETWFAELETFLKNSTFAFKWRAPIEDTLNSTTFKGNLHLWSIGKPVAIDVPRLAGALLQVYGTQDLDTLVPMLETYQGNRALDGTLPANKMVTDVRGYLEERLAATQSKQAGATLEQDTCGPSM